MKKKIYIWCCDNSKKNGEGILANKFIDDLIKYNKKYSFKIVTLSLKKINFLEKFLVVQQIDIYFQFLGFFTFGLYLFLKIKKNFVSSIICLYGIFCYSLYCHLRQFWDQSLEVVHI